MKIELQNLRLNAEERSALDVLLEKYNKGEFGFLGWKFTGLGDSPVQFEVEELRDDDGNVLNPPRRFTIP